MFNQIVILACAGCITLGLIEAKPKNVPETKEECIAACNTKYAAKYRECSDVKECQRFVENEGAACIKACSQ